MVIEILESLPTLLIVFLIFLGAIDLSLFLEQGKELSKLVIIISKDKLIPFSKITDLFYPDEEVFIKNLCERLRITTFDFTRAACIPILPEEEERYKVSEKELEIEMISGHTIEIIIEPQDYILVSFDPNLIFKV